MLDMTQAMAILIGICIVCLIGLLLVLRHYKKVRNQESKLESLGIIVPIEEEEIEPLTENAQVDEEYELITPYSVRDDFEARLLQKSLDASHPHIK